MAQKVKAKYKLKLNNVENLRELLQELYDESTMNITEIQNEINKLSQSTQLNQDIMDSKAKYAKAMNDFSSNKNKALGLKLDIAKMMVEIIKFNELEYTTPRVRIVINGEEVMSSEDNDTADIETRKYIEDGVLIIERGGVRYDAQGKRLE